MPTSRRPTSSDALGVPQIVCIDRRDPFAFRVFDGAFRADATPPFSLRLAARVTRFLQNFGRDLRCRIGRAVSQR